MTGTSESGLNVSQQTAAPPSPRFCFKLTPSSSLTWDAASPGSAAYSDFIQQLRYRVEAPGSRRGPHPAGRRWPAQASFSRAAPGYQSSTQNYQSGFQMIIKFLGKRDPQLAGLAMDVVGEQRAPYSEP